MNKFVVQIQYNEREGEFYIPIPDEMLSLIVELGWKVDDLLEWSNNEDGTLTVRKKEKDNE